MEYGDYKTIEEWLEAAEARPPMDDDALIVRRRQAMLQMVAAMRLEGVEPDAAFLRDQELFVTGRMSPEEHRAYLKAKYDTAMSEDA